MTTYRSKSQQDLGFHSPAYEHAQRPYPTEWGIGYYSPAYRAQQDAAEAYRRPKGRAP